MMALRPSADRRSQAIVGLCAAAYWILVLALLRGAPPHPLDDVWEDGVVARHLIAGAGFRSTVLYPPLWALRDPATLTVPVLVHGPLLPLALILPLRLFGPGVLEHLSWAAAAIAACGAVQTHRLASRWLEGPILPALAASLFTLAPVMLTAVQHSPSVVLGGGLLMASLDLLVRERPRTMTAGLVLGLASLIRPEMLLAAPILAALAAIETRPSAPLRFALGFVVPAAGWWVHQWRTSGLPMFNLSSYTFVGSFGDRPEHAVLRDFDLTPDRWPTTFRSALPGLWRKWIEFLPRAAWHALAATGATTGWLAPWGAWLLLRRSALRPATVACATLALLPVATMTLALPVALYLVPFLGLYALAAASGVGSRVGEGAARRWPARAWAPVLALLVAASTGPDLARAMVEARSRARLLAAERRGLAASKATAATRARPMFSDRPDFTAWTTGRPVLYVSRREYEALYPASGPIEGERAHGLPPRRVPRDTWFHAGYWAVGDSVP